MAEGSRAGWHGLPADRRVCARCGAKLTLKEPGGIWFDEAHRDSDGWPTVRHGYRCPETA